jgi:pectate lyase
LIPAFPGATGYGATTVGGRGGDVYYVTTLADSGTGSLRAALEATGPRTVVFGIAGTIILTSPVKVRNPYLTVAGQTAPGDGIVVRGETVRILTHDVIIRHLRFRTGDATTTEVADADGLTIHAEGGPIGNIILDHVDMVWGPDIGGLAVLGPVTDLTVQHSIIGEGLYFSRHPEGTAANGGHAYATNVTPMVLGGGYASRLTFYRNLFTDGDKRMPAIRSAECVDLVENVIYDWGRQAVAGNPRSLNIVGNWFRWGPLTETRALFKTQTVTADPTVYSDAVYLDSNVADGFTPATASGSVYASTLRCGGLSVPAGVDPSLLANVLDSAGATLPARDDVDRRILAEVSARTGDWFNGVDFAPPNPYWPDPAPGIPAVDSDSDGMADGWELAVFGDTSRDGRADRDADGYTDLEEFLNSTAP